MPDFPRIAAPMPTWRPPVVPRPMAAPMPLAQPAQAQQQPVKASGLFPGGGWDPLGELAFSLVGTPAAAGVGAAIGLSVAGPPGAALGALIGGCAPGLALAGRELLVHPFWKAGAPNPTPLKTVAALAAFPALTAIGYGLGLALGGPVGAAWGALIAAAGPVATILVGSKLSR